MDSPDIDPADKPSIVADLTEIDNIFTFDYAPDDTELLNNFRLGSIVVAKKSKQILTGKSIAEVLRNPHKARQCFAELNHNVYADLQEYVETRAATDVSTTHSLERCSNFGVHLTGAIAGDAGSQFWNSELLSTKESTTHLLKPADMPKILQLLYGSGSWTTPVDEKDRLFVLREVKTLRNARIITTKGHEVVNKTRLVGSREAGADFEASMRSSTQSEQTILGDLVVRARYSEIRPANVLQSKAVRLRQVLSRVFHGTLISSNQPHGPHSAQEKDEEYQANDEVPLHEDTDDTGTSEAGETTTFELPTTTSSITH